MVAPVRERLGDDAPAAGRRAGDENGALRALFRNGRADDE